MEWPLQKLETLCEVFTDGDWVESKNQSTEGVRLIQTGNVGDGNFKDRRDKARFISEFTFSELKCCEIYKGDCLVSRLPDPVGRSCILPATGDRMITAVDCTILRFKKDLIIPEFFNYYSQSVTYLNRIESLTSGATRKRISRKNLGVVDIPLPPIPEQKSVVAILDQAFVDIDKARANAEQNLKNARELFESYLNSRLLGVCSKKSVQTLSCITELIVDCEHKTAPTQIEGFPSIRTPNIGKGELLLENVKRVSKETYTLWTRRAEPEPGDLILAREAPAGNVGVIPGGQKVCLGQRTVLIRPIRCNVDSRYLAFLLLHPVMQNRLLGFSTGATVQHVNLKDIRQLAISELPSMAGQLTDVDALVKVKEEVLVLEKIYLDKLSSLDELKKSLLQKAFSGELTTEYQTSSPEYSANVIAYAYFQHAASRRDKTFGHVKTQKLLHLTESVAGIELGRNPIKDAAGPNDFAHMKKAENWAKQQQFFEFKLRPVGGYDFIKLARFDEMMVEANKAIDASHEVLADVVQLLIPMDKVDAEVFVTVHAAWNNLILNGDDITDEAIVWEAVENWHPDKKKIDRNKFFSMIQLIKDKSLAPDGTAKRVIGQDNLF